jgi:hypothetical protein
MFTSILLLLCVAADPAAAEHNAAFANAGFSCTIGDNTAFGEHCERYNGVYDIIPVDGGESPFVRKYAGLNLEHYFDARQRPDDSSLFFEPRSAAMTFQRLGERLSELHQPPTPFWGMESWTRFELSGPNCIDMHFRCTPAKDDFQGGFFGVFWASYINAPVDKSIYFLGESATLDAPRWEQLCTQKHGVASSVLNEHDTFNPTFANPGDLLYANLALMKYSVPMFYGRFQDYVLIYIFKPSPDTLLRFAQSPSGGGKNDGATTANPAWDFQMLVPGYAIGKEYSLEMRLVFKRWKGRNDVLNETRAYLGK